MRYINILLIHINLTGECMTKMDRIDVKYDNRKLFGTIIKQTPYSIVMDVKYPKDLEGVINMHPDDIDAITHDVYVPSAYRNKKHTTKPKRKLTKKRGCGCK
jgi:hypothetical protein